MIAWPFQSTFLGSLLEEPSSSGKNGKTSVPRWPCPSPSFGAGRLGGGEIPTTLQSHLFESVEHFGCGHYFCFPCPVIHVVEAALCGMTEMWQMNDSEQK